MVRGDMYNWYWDCLSLFGVRVIGFSWFCGDYGWLSGGCNCFCGWPCPDVILLTSIIQKLKSPEEISLYRAVIANKIFPKGSKAFSKL